MSKTRVRVVARVVAVPDKVEEVKSILLGLIEPTRQEEGCIVYELLQNQKDPKRFYLCGGVGKSGIAEYSSSYTTPYTSSFTTTGFNCG
jgi:hypothetical protein